MNGQNPAPVGMDEVLCRSQLVVSGFCQSTVCPGPHVVFCLRVPFPVCEDWKPMGPHPSLSTLCAKAKQPHLAATPGFSKALAAIMTPKSRIFT